MVSLTTHLIFLEPGRKTHMSFNTTIFCLCLYTCLFSQPALAQIEQATPSLEKESRQNSIRVAAETTIITHPLTDDGYVDYVAATDIRLGKDVPIEENAAIAFVRILDPADEWKYHRAVGTEQKTPMPSFLRWDDYIERIAPQTPVAVVDQLYKARAIRMSDPWRGEDDTVISNWLTANKDALDELAEATDKSRFCLPISSPADSLADILLPVVYASREVSDALTLRAMWHLGHARTGDAWGDLHACHRLARLIGQGPSLDERLAGFAMETSALSAKIVFVQSAVLSPEEITRFQLQDSTLPQNQPIAENIENGERFSSLDCTQLLAMSGMDLLQEIYGDDPDVPVWTSQLVRSGVDWNAALIVVNRWYDRCTKIARITSPAKRREAWRDLQGLESQVAGLEIAELLAGSAKAKGRVVGKVVLGLRTSEIQFATRAEDRIQDYRQLARIAFALEAYRVRNGRYPSKLSSLAPITLHTIPLDRFKEAPYEFKAQIDKYVLYGVGNNFKDDGGSRVLDNVVSSNDAKQEE
jgi:hypothetical protein